LSLYPSLREIYSIDFLKETKKGKRIRKGILRQILVFDGGHPKKQQ